MNFGEIFKSLILVGLADKPAFAFFDPTSFELAPMDANAQSLYSDFTNIKSANP
jgi:hypothetical protein